MKTFQTLLALALPAQAFFWSSCKYPSRNSPTVSEIKEIGFEEGGWGPFKTEMADHGLVPNSVDQGPSVTGQITNLPELYQALKAAYNYDKGDYGPISISKAQIKTGSTTEDIYLVLIAGTELFGPIWEVSNNAISNVKIFFQPEKDSWMRRNTRYAMLNEIPRGAKVVMAGHSQGGMIARQLASDEDIKSRFTILRTICFGSPHTSLFEPIEGDIIMFQSPDDIVPKLDETKDALYEFCSWITFGLFCPPSVDDHAATVTIDSNFAGNPLFAHNYEYGREDAGSISMQYDAMGEKNSNAEIHFTPGRRVFYTAPSDTCAE